MPSQTHPPSCPTRANIHNRRRHTPGRQHDQHTGAMRTLLHALDRLITSPTAKTVATAWRGMTNLLVPNPCALCVWDDAVTHQLCQRCTALIKEQTRQLVQAQDFADALPVDLVTGRPLPIFSASLYTPELSKVLLKYKDHQCIKIAGLFRPIMYRTLQYATEYLHHPYYRLIPIPASGASMRQRGYNPVTTMLPRQLPAHLTLDTSLLKTRWHFWNQAAHRGTGVQTRREQSRKKFRLRSGHQPPADPIMLVDDVLTSGATLAAATRTLQAAGFDVAAGVVLSAVPPRN